MSVRATTWAWTQRVDDFGAKLVLLKLADQANDHGECWPGQRTLAADCEMSRATVQRKLNLLSEKGLLTVEEGHGRGYSSNVYRLQGVPQPEAGGASRGEAGGASLLRHRNVIEPSMNLGTAPPEPRNAKATFLCPVEGCHRSHTFEDDLLAHLEIDHGRAA